MSKRLLKFAAAIFAAGLGGVLWELGSGAAVVANPQLAQAGQIMTQSRNVHVVLTCDQAKASMHDALTTEVAIRNDGENPVYVYRTLDWGFMGGLLLHIRDEKGDLIQSPFFEDALPEPPPPDDPTIFVRLEAGVFYGTRTKRLVKDMVTRPGKYTLQVEYWSPLPRKYVDIKVRSLPALWHEDPSLYSNKLSLEVVP